MKKIIIAFIFALLPRLAATDALTVDFSVPQGKIKALHGMNLYANMSNRGIFDLTPLMDALHLPAVRLHDAPLENPGIRLVDVDMIFGNPHADPDDPKNYFFAATDDYLQSIIKSGAGVIYRLGPSIEHSAPRKYFAKKPHDVDRFASVCAHIIRHYNEGWADGFQWNLTHWEIWNEPDLGKQMWDKSFREFCDFYITVAKYLKRRFPNLKIGGPALCSGTSPQAQEFIRSCHAAQAPLDFFSWHDYTKDVAKTCRDIHAVRKNLDHEGYTATELHLNEWHYMPVSFQMLYLNLKHNITPQSAFCGPESGSFNVLALTRFQDTPLTMANFYAADLLMFSLFDPVNYAPGANYYSFQAFSRLARETPNRARAVDSGRNISLLAGTGNGKKLILLAGHKTEKEGLTITLNGVPPRGTAVITSYAEGNGQETTQEYSDGRLNVAAPAASYFMLIEIK